jgi:peptidoglycan LD-endopeptidase LytH
LIIRRTTPLLIAIAACTRPMPTVIPVPLDGPEAGAPPVSIALPPVPRAASDVSAVHAAIIIPVAGVRVADIQDSFDAPRDGERRHNAIDILAPRGTPILAARLSTNELGGITIYASGGADRYVFYYAHLERYHASMSVGRHVARGDTIGFVGTTGNAPKDVPHLHFQVMRMPEDGKYWNGEPINPYPILTGLVVSTARDSQ